MARASSSAIALCVLMISGCSSSERTPVDSQKKCVLETYTQATDPALEMSSGSSPIAPPVTIEDDTRQLIVYTCRHARCEILKEAIENFASPQGTVQATPQLNVLLINDTISAASALLKLVEELDRPQPQLLVEARVLEITVDNDFEQEMKALFTVLPAGFKQFWQSSGIVLGTPGANPNPTQGGQITIRPLVNDEQYLDMFIRLLVTKGYARILSSPNLIVGAGSEAGIITGEEVPVQSATVVSGSVSTTTVFKRVGIKLYVTPLQIAGTTVKLDIAPEVSAVTGYTASGESGVSNPIVAVRNVRSTLTMKDGQVLTIGGLLKSEDRRIVSKVPGLGDVPGIGELFTSKRLQTTNTQLIFFLRVKILPEGQQNELSYHKPGAGMDGIEDSPIVPHKSLALPTEEPPIESAPRVIRLTQPRTTGPEDDITSSTGASGEIGVPKESPVSPLTSELDETHNETDSQM